MKQLIFLLLLGSLILLQSSSAQDARPVSPRPVRGSQSQPQPDSDLATFDLDFPGGTPKSLVEAIQKSMGKSLNVIIPEEFAKVSMTPLKLRKVNVVQVFNALSLAGTKTERYISGYSVNPMPVPGFRGGAPGGQLIRNAQYSIWETKYGFRTSDQRPSENSIWYFYHEAPPPPASPEPEIPPVRSFRCWQLGPTLDSFTIEDITTAIETTWKMLGSDPLPKMSFHKETKLLIVVGTDKDLSVVNGVLEQLPGAANQSIPRRLGGTTPARTVPASPNPSGNTNPQ
jgi:hypothetical protein